MINILFCAHFQRFMDALFLSVLSRFLQVRIGIVEVGEDFNITKQVDNALCYLVTVLQCYILVLRAVSRLP